AAAQARAVGAGQDRTSLGLGAGVDDRADVAAGLDAAGERPDLGDHAVLGRAHRVLVDRALRLANVGLRRHQRLLDLLVRRIEQVLLERVAQLRRRALELGFLVLAVD